MQGLAVSLIVAAAAGYAAWQLMPQSMRRWLIGRLMVVAPSRRARLAPQNPYPTRTLNS